MRRKAPQEFRLGFCEIDRHERCPGYVENGANASKRYVRCRCSECKHSAPPQED